MKKTFHGKDSSQDAIVAALKAAGASVQDLSRIATPGVPDLLVGYLGRNFLIECKPATGSNAQLNLRPSQVKWHNEWQGRVYVANSPEQALAIIGTSDWRAEGREDIEPAPTPETAPLMHAAAHESIGAEQEQFAKRLDSSERARRSLSEATDYLQARLAAERALADRLAETLANVQGDYAATGAITVPEVDESLAAWKESRREP